MVVSRRQFITRFGCTLVESFVEPTKPDAPSRAPDTDCPPADWVRPPGALPEPRFLEKCTRCTDCLVACPRHSIRRLGPEFDKIQGTPAIIPLESPCVLCHDLPCIQACPTGALVPTPIPELAMGTAVVDGAACYIAHDLPCDYCIEHCPLTGQAIARGTDGIPVVNELACVGCGVCAHSCPPVALRISRNRCRDVLTGRTIGEVVE